MPLVWLTIAGTGYSNQAEVLSPCGSIVAFRVALVCEIFETLTPEIIGWAAKAGELIAKRAPKIRPVKIRVFIVFFIIFI